MRKPANGYITTAFAALIASMAPLAVAGAQTVGEPQAQPPVAIVVTGSTPPPAPAVHNAAPVPESVAVGNTATTASAGQPVPVGGSPAASAHKDEVRTASPAPLTPTAADASRPVDAANPAATAAQTKAPEVVPPAETKPAVAIAPPQPQIDPRIAPVAEIVRQLDALPSTRSKPEQEHRAALAAYYAKEGARTLFVTPQGLTADARSAAELITQADDWGLRSKDFVLPVALPADPSPSDVARAEIALALAALEYVRQARGGRIVPTDLSYSIDRKLDLVKPQTALADLAVAPSATIYLRQQHPRHPQFERLRRAYIAARDGNMPAAEEPAAEPEQPVKGKKQQASKKPQPKVLSREQQLATLQRNIEMWRWMPRDLGRFHVIANIPEYAFRLVRNDTIEHEERVIVGKVEKQTPVFSDEMDHLVFQPFWGVPDSIKVKELLPGLARGGNPLSKNGLRMQLRGRDVQASQINWRQVDIRNVHVFQPPGPANVLGQVKFMFPNAHQVYMHDTPTKHLFNAGQRTFSHGCVRVRNPVRFAELLLAEDKGWSPAKVRGTLNDGPENNNIKLNRKIPVHMAYFTATVGDDGKVRYFTDVYGHEKLVQMALDGKAHLIVKKKDNLDEARAEVIGRLSENTSSNDSWWGGGGSSGYSGGSGGGNPAWARDAFRSD